MEAITSITINPSRQGQPGTGPALPSGAVRPTMAPNEMEGGEWLQSPSAEVLSTDMK